LNCGKANETSIVRDAGAVLGRTAAQDEPAKSKIAAQ
jgi:hypothetical protein